MGLVREYSDSDRSTMSEPKFTTQITKREQQSITTLKRLVDAAGGNWCGVQEGFLDKPALLLFTSRTTGSTLATPFNPRELNEAELHLAVCKRIAESDALFAARPVYVKVAVLKRIANTLLELSTEIDNLYLKGKS